MLVDPKVADRQAIDDVIAKDLANELVDQQLAGLDALEQASEPRTSLARRMWSATWPKLGAIAIALFLWQCVVWSGWRPEYALPGPATVLSRLWDMLFTAELWEAVGVTLRRGAYGFAIAIVVGVVVGALVSQFKVLRSAVGSLITGLQTMPSIAWFPAAIVLFKLSEAAITFVVVLGAAPSVANGLINGVDQIPPNLTRVGRVLGARGISAFRHIVLPAAMPSFIGGLKQGWAFAWRSLLAGELIVIIANQTALGQLLQFNRDVSDYTGMYAVMLVILIIGIVLDSLVFGTLERRIRRKRGLLT